MNRLNVRNQLVKFSISIYLICCVLKSSLSVALASTELSSLIYDAHERIVDERMANLHKITHEMVYM